MRSARASWSHGWTPHASSVRDAASRVNRVPPAPGEACRGSRRLLSDHEHRRVRVRRGHARHDGGVGDPQSLDAVHPEPIVHDRPAVRRRPHPARPHHVERGGADAPGEVQDLLVGAHLVAGQRLVCEVRRERRGTHEPPGEPDAVDDHPAVHRVGEIARLDRRLVQRVGAARPDVSAALRAMLPHRDRGARLVFQGGLHAAPVARGREGDLQVGRVERLVRRPEAVHQGRLQGEDPGPEREVLRHLDPEPPASRKLVDRPHAPDPERGADRVVVAQVLAHPGQRLAHGDPQLAEQPGRPDPRELQELRRVDGPAGDDHLARRAHHPPLAAAQILHPDRAVAFEQDPRRVGVRAHVDVAPLHGGAQVRARGAHPAVAVDAALEVADAFLPLAVVVGVARDADALRAGDERLAQRMTPVEILDHELAVAAPVPVVARPDAAFAAPEVGQHVRIAPPAVAELRPGVEVHALAAVVDVAVDRARPAERLAPRLPDPAPRGALARLGLVEPVDRRVGQRLHESGGDVDERMPVPASGLQRADPVASVRAQAVDEGGARGAGTDDDEVEDVPARHGVRHGARSACRRGRAIRAPRTASSSP